MSKPGNLYVVHAIGTGHYKIGITRRDVALRLKELQTGNHHKLEVVRSYWVSDMDKYEALLHQALAAHSVNGEWYELQSPVQVDQLLEDEEVFFANVIDGYVLRQVGNDAVSARFVFCLEILSNSDLGSLGKLILFLWALFVPLAPRIELVALTDLEKKQHLHEWYYLSDHDGDFQSWE